MTNYGKTTLRNAGLRHIPIKISGIYQIKNTLDGKFYIGSAADVRKRLRHHFIMLRNGVHSSRHLQNAWNRDGEEAFAFDVLEIVGKEAIYEREQWWLDATKCYDDEIGYNICRIVEKPPVVVYDDDMRAKISERFKGKPKSEEHRRKIGEAHKGQKHTQAHIERHRAALKEYWANPAHREAQSQRKKGTPAHNKGIPHAEETKELISQKAKERYQNPDEMEALRQRGLKGAAASKASGKAAEKARARKGMPNLKNRVYTDEQVAQWKELREKNMSYSAIAKLTGIDVAVIFRRLTKK